MLGPAGGGKQISGLEQGLGTRHGQDMDLHGLEIGVCESGGPRIRVQRHHNKARGWWGGREIVGQEGGRGCVWIRTAWEEDLWELEGEDLG